MGDAKFDHLISLQLGGDPNDYRSLWVEPADPGHKKGAGVNNAKDPVETKLHTAVCKGQVTLASGLAERRRTAVDSASAPRSAQLAMRSWNLRQVSARWS
jgi:hypothetical protein